MLVLIDSISKLLTKSNCIVPLSGHLLNTLYTANAAHTTFHPPLSTQQQASLGRPNAPKPCFSATTDSALQDDSKSKILTLIKFLKKIFFSQTPQEKTIGTLKSSQGPFDAPFKAKKSMCMLSF
jgi:hypothetical protein